MPEEAVTYDTGNDAVMNTMVATDSIQAVTGVHALEHPVPEKQRKLRWKATGKETAKKTKKLQEKRAAKAGNKKKKK